MDKKKLAISSAFAALAVFSPAAIGQDVGAAYAYAQMDQYSYENDGMTLLIPKDYDKLLVTERIVDQKNGMLFSVSEKASIEAAKHLPYDMHGAGWLFAIGRVDE